jgi:protocatechuate 3,4-dioxygenase alpha subunit
MDRLPPTPSQTVGPFFGYALPFAAGGEIAPAGHPDAVVLRGAVYDGAGAPVPDALLELWQGGPGAPGSLRRDPSSGVVTGRNGIDDTRFGRIATDADGGYVARIVAAPYVSVCVFARGLLHHLFTRAYLSAQALESAAGLAALPEARRSTLLARPERPGVYRFDIRLQGDEETVFLDFQ